MADTKDLKHARLIKAKDLSRKKLEPFRQNRADALKEYAGMHYGSGASNKAVPVNMIEMSTTIHMSQLAAQRPHVLVTTIQDELKPQAANWELEINSSLDDMNLEQTFQNVLFDSLFSIGICKVGIHPNAQVQLNEIWHDLGEPFADRIDLDDWVHDMAARSFEELSFAGHRYRMPLKLAKESELFKGKEDRLIATEPTDYNEEGGDRVEKLGIDGNRIETSYEESLDLWDLWIPEEQRVLTFLATGDHNPLRSVEWEGPEEGPFYYLYYSTVPNHVMPLPPCSTWMDLHKLINELYRKLGRQAARQKKNLQFQSGSAEDAERIRKSRDGEVYRVDRPGATQETTLGGIDSQTFAFAIHAKNLFANLAGNLDLLGGLSPQSETLGQDQLLAANANKRIAFMQSRVKKFATEVIRTIGWYEWTEPVKSRWISKPLPGSDMSIPILWSPDDRKGQFLDFNFSVVPHSMEEQSPRDRLRLLMQIYQQVIVPMMPSMAQQGISLDIEKWLRLISKYAALPELADILTFVNAGEEGGAMGEARQSPSTTRTNVRVNQPGGSPSQAENAMMQGLMGGGGMSPGKLSRTA